MRRSVKQSLVLAFILFAAGIGFTLLYTTSAVDEMCTGFEVTAMVTQANPECSTFFNGMMIDSTIWLALWGVLAFFIFLIFIDYFLPEMEKKKKKK